MLYVLCLNIFSAEPPSLTAQPQRKIFAELDRNVDIPCLAKGTLRICYYIQYIQNILKQYCTCQYVH